MKHKTTERDFPIRGDNFETVAAPPPWLIFVMSGFLRQENERKNDDGTNSN